ncbi:Putative HDA1 complex subunit 2/3 protein [Septoria linicola]|uniref:HDA1 complex subunit 2/3 protein n=1 Tax=Septoria linicola TaxID=215465 RepID=A0A9Q9AT15_9PEZI|nr:putative HDA1 complex subunit 2/3 protein [Septoria linicola]USW51441.1 Putative HDA1 complex subunit 2/3 protein [Septoria linicola]
MAGKRGRKRSIPEDSGRPRERLKKRAKGAHSHGKINYEKDYKVRSIIGEDKTKYHIDWEPDSDTGENYEPTWEPKANANQLAIDDWERKKTARSNPLPALVASNSDSAPPVPSRKGRTRKVIQSSSPAPEETTTAPEQQPDQRSSNNATVSESEKQLVASEPEPEIGETQQSPVNEVSLGSPLFATSRQAPTEKGFVAHSSPPSSYLAGQYQKFGSRPASKDGAERSQSVPSFVSAAPNSSALAVLRSTADELGSERALSASAPGPSTQKSTNSTSLVIPESQSQELVEESSFRGFSPTQRADPTSLLQTLEEEISQGAANQLAAELGQQLEASRPFPVEEQSREPVPQPTQDPLVATVGSAQSDNHASPLDDDISGDRHIDPVAQGAEQASPVAVRLISDTAPDQTQTSTNTSTTSQTSGQRKVIVISSTEEQSGQSTSLNLESSVHEADYEPPPAGQRPPPSSVVTVDPSQLVRPSQVTTVSASTQQQVASQIDTPAGLTLSQGLSQPRTIHYYGPSQSSFPFQTQVPRPFTPQKLESPADFTYTPGSRALFIPTESPARSPSIVSSRLPDSTPFPSIPTHSLAIGESAPRPISLSSSAHESIMESSLERRETLAEKMKRIRDERAAKRQSATPVPSTTNSIVNGHIGNGAPASALPPNLIAEVAVAQAARLGSPLLAHERSPSTVPAVEAIAPISREEMTTSERYETLLPQAHDGNSGEVEAHQNDAPTSVPEPQTANEDPELAGVHVVPVAPSAHQRDQYQNSIYYERALVGEVLAAQTIDDDLLTRASKFLQGLRNIAMHPDLINPETLSQTAESDIQARWDIKCSAKFCFLNEFISNLADQNLHIAIVAHGLRIPDMLHKFLAGINVPVKRWAQPLSIDPDLSPSNLGLKVSIVDLDGGPQNVEPADVVVAMDSSTDCQHPLIRAVRKQTGTDGIKWAMLLTLVVPRTIEHVESCLQADMSPQARIKLLVKATNELRWEAGRLESTQAPLVEAASAIADYMEDTSADWPIAGLSQLEELDSQTETDIQPDSHSAKRTLDEMQEVDESTSSKRARLSPAPSLGTQFPGTINPLDMDITHISDSLAKGTQSNAEANSSREIATATEQRLRELLQGVQHRLDEHIRALEALQYRHEDQRKELVDVKKERDAAILTAQTAVSRMAGAEANNAALRTERTQLKEALADANRRLLDHAVPEVRELQELRVLAEQAKAEQEKAIKKAAATEKDLDWTRSMYQDSSNRARELAQNNTELENRLSHATHIAKGEQARAREVSFQGHNKQLEQENKKLKQTMENLKLAMKNKDEQISSLKEGRGRMGTRQSSVPRSPRMGSPMKGGRLSRQASPAASEARGRTGHLHPLRNSAGG